MSGGGGFIAVDLGAESGRAMLGTLREGRLDLKEVHRFANRPCLAGGTLQWDVLSLFSEIKAGIRKACQGRPAPAGIGVDTWGVDFGLLDSRGELIGNPVHYRDARCHGILERAFEIVPRRELYMRTGIQFLQFNSIFQLLAMRLAGSAQLEAARELLMMPDLLNYWLTGARSREFTNATTTQAYDTLKGEWAWDLIDAFKIPRALFGPVTPPAGRLAVLRHDVADECGADADLSVLLPATHDTGSAVAAVPGEGADWAYISCGTWALVGMETPAPVITDAALGFNFTNEGGVFGTNRLLSNVMGLWLLQRARAAWEAEGLAMDYARIAELAAGAAPLAGWLDPDDAAFFNPPNMVGAVLEFGRRTGQDFPREPGPLARLIMEGLALKYRHKLRQAEELTGRRIGVIHVVGGGSRNELLCQMTADACNCRVIAGPAEATAIGNTLVQACAAGLLGGLADIRSVVRRSSELKTFTPSPSREWDRLHDRLAAHLAAQE